MCRQNNLLDLAISHHSRMLSKKEVRTEAVLPSLKILISPQPIFLSNPT